MPADDSKKPRLALLAYVPQNFRDLFETQFGQALWDFMRREDNLIRMETANILERPAVEPLAPFLVLEFGDQIKDERCKQMVGHMARQVMEALGYKLDRKSMRITRPNLFTTGTTYIPAGASRTMKVTKEQREAWAKNTKNSPFNQWLDAQVKNGDGSLNLDALYRVAQKYGIDKRYDNLNPGQQRMNIGVQLRKIVPPTEYGG
ncbi:hypothetical protein [Mesorhizobium sp. SP-1A]|uniref:hypothetical protein n=1 Tax=Mesorhizobium sp. SP-1A TaxID=3077840 RepID=UPI0028F6C513|nr:hypothetical protein [Mesorhizobium sp. SP-1A]